MAAYPQTHSSPPPVPSPKPAPIRRETPLGMPVPQAGVPSVLPRREGPLGISPPGNSAHPPRRATPLGVPATPDPTARSRASQVPLAPVALSAPAPPPVDTTLSPEIQEQLFGILRAALDASFGPLIEKQKQLEARLEQLRTVEARLGEASQRAASAERRADAADERAAVAASRPPMRSMAPSLSVDITPSVPPPASRVSIIPTSYGYVIEPVGPSKRPPMEIALEKVGPIEIPDFGTRGKTGKILVAVLVAGLLAVILAMFLSYT